MGYFLIHSAHCISRKTKGVVNKQPESIFHQGNKNDPNFRVFRTKQRWIQMVKMWNNCKCERHSLKFHTGDKVFTVLDVFI